MVIINNNNTYHSSSPLRGNCICTSVPIPFSLFTVTLPPNCLALSFIPSKPKESRRSKLSGSKPIPLSLITTSILSLSKSTSIPTSDAPAYLAQFVSASWTILYIARDFFLSNAQSRLGFLNVSGSLSFLLYSYTCHPRASTIPEESNTAGFSCHDSSRVFFMVSSIVSFISRIISRILAHSQELSTVLKSLSIIDRPICRDVRDCPSSSCTS